MSLCIIASVVANCITYSILMRIDVVTLTDSNFDSLVMAPNAGRWFVKVYAPVGADSFVKPIVVWSLQEACSHMGGYCRDSGPGSQGGRSIRLDKGVPRRSMQPSRRVWRNDSTFKVIPRFCSLRMWAFLSANT